MTIFLGLPQHILIFAAILGVLLLSFVFFSLIPSLLVSRQLVSVIKSLISLNGKPDEHLEQVFQGGGPVLLHLWKEYEDSLHKQAGEGGVRFRSTMPAGVVFRPDILVDIPLRTDFFKHLPGLFTGVGIIGTFYGLLVGLRSFVVSENTIIVRESLTRLLHGVSEAFLISACAITLAMIVTFVEKLVLTRLNAKVEQLVQLLDGLFEGGAGEEYLARLVRASETSASQNVGFLKGELRQMLAELSDAQIAAANASSLVLGDRIAASIETGLKVPLAEIAEALKRDDLTVAFEELSRQLLLSSQASESVLQLMLVKLDAMVLSTAGLSDAISRQIAEVISAADTRQAVMNEKLLDSIEQIRTAVSQSQAESQGGLQDVLSELSAQMGKVFDGLGTQVNSVTDAAMRHQQQLEEQNQAVLGQFGGHIADMIEGVKQAVVEIQSAVTVMHNTTGKAMSALGNSADTLQLASGEFARAADGVTAVMDKSALVAEQLVEAADTVSAATGGLNDLFTDYQTSRDAMLDQMRSLQLLAEQVRHDASMSGDVLQKIEAATASLVSAQKDADNYLSRISEVLSVAHQSFSEGMTRTVGEANREFHQALSDSVKLLREGIHELEATLDVVTGA